MTERQNFNLKAALGNLDLEGRTIKMDFKKLSIVATATGISGMDSPKTAREAFVQDIISLLSSGDWSRYF